MIILIILIDILNFSGIFPVMMHRRFLLSSIILGLAILSCTLSGITDPTVDITQTDTPTVFFKPTETKVPTATPLPTLVPAVRILNADRAFFNGDWETAHIEYQGIQLSDSDPEIQAAALLGMGRSRHQMGQFDDALIPLNYLVENYLESASSAAAYFELAQIYETLFQFAEAANAYQRFLELRPGVIDGYVYEWLGDALASSGDTLGAIGAYQAALASSEGIDPLAVEVKIANIYALTGEYQTALIAFQDIYHRTTNDFTKAHMDLRIGQTYSILGQQDEAYQAYLDSVVNFPLSYDAYQALILLVEAGYPVSEFDRGLVDYYAGQYTLSIEAFDRYLSVSSENAGAAFYYKGLAYLYLNDPEAAIANWDVLIQSYLSDEKWDDAWDEKAYTQWAYLNQYTASVETLLSFVHDYPWHDRAAEFLFNAARIAERSGELEQAARIWERLPTEYPSSSLVSDAIFQAGIAHYRDLDYSSALATFEWALRSSIDHEEKSRSYFWIAKTYQALGNDTEAELFFGNAADQDPTGYYSERAQDLLAHLDPFTEPIMYDLGFDLESEAIAAESWLQTNFLIPEGNDPSTLGELGQDPRLLRGTALWDLGKYELARAEFEALRKDLLQNPLDNYRLTVYLTDLGLYRSAIFAARQVLNLHDMDDAQTLTAPVFFNHIRFGPYYQDLILSISGDYDFHPLFLMSVVRQESLFEGFVRSSAGARGLMQIMPTTAESIVLNLGWPPGYTSEDLYRPFVNIILGVDYLDSQRAYFNGNLYAALAAYNAGPGNALIWLELSQDDKDLFLEIIRYKETQDYIKGIFEVYTIYRQLYDRSP